MVDLLARAFGTSANGSMSKATETSAFADTDARETRRARAWLNDRIARSKKLPEGEFIDETTVITPVAAAVFLEHNIGNRAAKPKRFKFAEDMKEGRWKTMHQGLSFTRSGVLNDGQNRLMAICLAGVPVKMKVTFGDGDDVFPVVDTGSPRGGADTLHVSGRKNTAVLAASARLLHIVTSDAPFANASIGNDKVLEIVVANPRLEDATTSGSTVGKRLRFSSGGATVAFFLIARDSASARRLDRFVELLREGNLPDKSDAILKLRDGLRDHKLDQNVRGGTQRAVIHCAAIILAWNRWLRGRKTKLSDLYWPGTFPEVE